MGFWTGTEGEMMQQPTMTGGQTNFLSQMMSSLMGGGKGFDQQGPMGMGIQNLMQILSGSPEAMKAFEAPYMRQFQEQTVPSLAERFSSLGSGAQGSSAFGQALGQAGAGLSENLAAQRGHLQQGALSQLLGMGQMGLGARQFENIYKPATPGFLQSMAPGLGSALGVGLTGGMGRFGSAGMAAAGGIPGTPGVAPSGLLGWLQGMFK